jgi:hypothetical protein
MEIPDLGNKSPVECGCSLDVKLSASLASREIGADMQRNSEQTETFGRLFFFGKSRQTPYFHFQRDYCSPVLI